MPNICLYMHIVYKYMKHWIQFISKNCWWLPYHFHFKTRKKYKASSKYQFAMQRYGTFKCNDSFIIMVWKSFICFCLTWTRIRNNWSKLLPLTKTIAVGVHLILLYMYHIWCSSTSLLTIVLRFLVIWLQMFFLLSHYFLLYVYITCYYCCLWRFMDVN